MSKTLASPSRPDPDPDTTFLTDPVDSFGLFEPVPRWELGYGSAGSLEHWVDHPAEDCPARSRWSETVRVLDRTVAPSWWQRFTHWMTH